MPHGARTSLVALILLLGVGGATAEPAAGSTWTDPPAHKRSAETPPAADKKAAAPAAVSASTPAAASPEVRPPRAKRKAVAVRRAPERTAIRRIPATKRVVAAPRRTRIAATPARTLREPQVAAAVPSPPEGYARYRAYGYGPGYGPGYADERLDRLSSAEAAGYLVVRRRTVQFPDGRTLRYYRPDDEGEPF
jgi:hypothetical protein